MPLVETRINEMLEDMKAELANITIATQTWTEIQNYLGNDLSTDPNPTIATGENNKLVKWGTAASATLQSTNSPTDTPLNFTVKPSLIARTAYFTSGTDVLAIMELPTTVSGSTYGAGLFLEYLKTNIQNP